MNVFTGIGVALVTVFAVSAQRAAGLTNAACGAGADAVLDWPPPGSAGLLAYYAGIREAPVGRPVLARHIPWVLAAGDAIAQRELADRHLAVRAGGAALKEILAASHGTSAAVMVP